MTHKVLEFDFLDASLGISLCVFLPRTFMLLLELWFNEDELVILNGSCLVGVGNGALS